jgi:Rps23 Pro-64 3,4-dihydroxylase Tpa1-like proline 4-hydroxylase
MKKKTINTSVGKIVVIDDLFDRAFREQFYFWVKSSSFTTSGEDISTLEYKGDYNLYSSIEEQSISNSGFSEHKEFKEHIEPELAGMFFKQARINLSTLNDNNRFHTDSIGSTKTKTLLYYPNLKWDIEWGGHTLFTDDNLEEIEYCCMYKPGRIVIFDGNIPHCILPPTKSSPSYRFSFVMQYGE